MNSCLESMRNTSSFMVMSINRCIDFTKASSGFALKPSVDTCELGNVVAVPIKTITNLQTRLQVTLEEPDCDRMCPFVVTDGQWVQENLLCLLSNAVKYTSKGAVTVRISLKTADALNVEYVLQGRGGGILSEPRTAPANTDAAGVHQRVTGSPRGAHRKQPIDSSAARRVDVFRAKWRQSFWQQETIDEEAINYALRRASTLRVQHMPSQSTAVTKSTESGRSRLSRHQSELRMGSLHFLDASAENSLSCGESSASRRSTSLRAVHKEFVVIEVADTGIGLSEVAAASLFSPFTQAQRLSGGTGLGLYSLAKRVDALHGRYGVKLRDDGSSSSSRGSVGVLVRVSVPPR